jgi:putative membrane protein
LQGHGSTKQRLKSWDVPACQRDVGNSLTAIEGKDMQNKTFFKFLFLTSACAVMISIHAQAPGSSASQTTIESPDAAFVRAAIRGGLAEVELSKLALNSTAPPAVIVFAQKMVHDHTQNNKDLAMIAAHENIEVPTNLDREHAQLRDKLVSLHGVDFDRAYINAMRGDHQKMADMLISSESTVSTEELRTFIKQTLPVVYEHLRMASDLQIE